MKKLIYKYLILLSIFVLQVNFLAVYALEGTNTDDQKIKENNQFLQRFKDELKYTKTDYRQIIQNVSDMEMQLGEVVQEKINLSSQIKSLDVLISETTTKLANVNTQVNQTENEIKVILEEINNLKIAFEYQKQLLKDFAKTLYQEQNNYFSIEDDGSIETFKLLLDDNSVGINMMKLDNLELMNQTGIQIIEKLNSLNETLTTDERKLFQKKEKLDKLKEEIVQEKQQLETQKEAKEKLLSLTLGQEEIFSQLLAQSMEEQNSVLNEIRGLNNAITFIEDRIAIEGADFDAQKYTTLLSQKNKALYEFQVRYRGLNAGIFDWPVEPYKGLSAYFRDPSYVGVFGVRHNAIDIPTFQETPVRAASDGVVYTVKDNGYGYSYIILVHTGGISTVYGHINKMLVNEGDLVVKGTIIGLSGGMPGTKGAGYMTTGPHLHFEMLLNNSFVDPLEYLPLAVLTEAQVKALPEKYFIEWLTAFPNAQQSLLSRI